MSLVMCECFEMIKECLWSWFYIQTTNLAASATLCLQAAKRNLKPYIKSLEGTKRAKLSVEVISHQEFINGSKQIAG